MKFTLLVYVGSLILLSCSTDNIHAFYLSKSPVSGVVSHGTLHCTALLLNQNNEFTICSFIYRENEGNINNTKSIAKGIYEIKNDTLKLQVSKGGLDKDEYLINYENNEVSSLTFIPAKLYDDNNKYTGIDIKGPETNKNAIERKLIKEITRQLKQNNKS